MLKEQSQFITARLKVDTKRKAERAKIQYKFRTFEDALDDLILTGIKAKRQAVNHSQVNS